MQNKLTLAVLLTIVAGCAPKADDSAKATPPAEQPAAAAPKGGNAESVQPMTSNVGGITPVQGSDSVAGSSGYGGGLGDAAKRQARKAAATESQPTPPPSDSGN